MSSDGTLDRAALLTLAASVVTHIGSVLPMFLVGALAVRIRADLGLSPAQIGAAVSVFTATAAVLSIHGGRWIERIGWRTGLAVASATSIVGVTSVALLARSFATLLIALIIGGVGFAVVVPAANLALVRGVVVRQPFVFGIKQSAGPMATFVSGLAVPVLALRFGWRPTFALAAAIPVAALFLLRTTRTPRRHRTTPTRPAGNPGPRLPVGRLRPLLSLTVAGFLGSSVVAALSAFLVLAAVDAGIGEGKAGTLLAAGSVTGITARIGLGWLVDRHTMRPLRTVVGLLAVGALSIGAFATGSPVVLVPATLVGFATAWGWPGLYHYAVVTSYPHAPAAATGITSAGMTTGGALGPFLFGLTVERWSFTTAWLIASALILVAAAVAAASELQLRAGRDISRPSSSDPGTSRI